MGADDICQTRELATSNTAGEIHYVHDECGETIDGFGIELGPYIDVGVVCSREVSEIQTFSDSHTLKPRSGGRSRRCFWHLPLISAHPPADDPHFSNAFGSVDLRVTASPFLLQHSPKPNA